MTSLRCNCCCDLPSMLCTDALKCVGKVTEAVPPGSCVFNCFTIPIVLLQTGASATHGSTLLHALQPNRVVPACMKLEPNADLLGDSAAVDDTPVLQVHAMAAQSTTAAYWVCLPIQQSTNAMSHHSSYTVELSFASNGTLFCCRSFCTAAMHWRPLLTLIATFTSPGRMMRLD